MDELFYLLGKVQSSRFVDMEWWSNKKHPNNGWSKVKSIELLPKQEMIDIQTSEKTYIANGFVSHNSTAVTGYAYHYAITHPACNLIRMRVRHESLVRKIPGADSLPGGRYLQYHIRFRAFCTVV